MFNIEDFKKKLPATIPVSQLPEEEKELIRQRARELLPKGNIPTTQEQLTDIQLALIEIYEVILDG